MEKGRKALCLNVTLMVCYDCLNDKSWSGRHYGFRALFSTPSENNFLTIQLLAHLLSLGIAMRQNTAVHGIRCFQECVGEDWDLSSEPHKIGHLELCDSL